MSNKVSKPSLLISIYRILFLRKAFFKLNKIIFKIGLRGIGILNYENDSLSGEEYFLHKMASFFKNSNSVAIDIGANIGDYSNTIRSLSPQTKIYAFEPHPITFEQLKSNANEHNYEAENFACSNVAGQMKLYDYADNPGSQHASAEKGVIEMHGGKSKEWNVSVTTIDEFVARKNNEITKIALLKIDTEGNELKVLLGAQRCIAANLIDIIHLEFNVMNVLSRVFMKDICEILTSYSFYRLLPDGLVPLGEYQVSQAIYWEIFGYQNIIAVNKNSFPLVKSYLNI